MFNFRFVIALVACLLFFDSYAVTARRTAANSATTAAASATSARAAVRGAAPAASKGTVGARAAVRRGGAAPVAGGKPAVSARAATTQKVVQSGTKVSTAAKNTLQTECQEKYNGCMDAICMVENTNGGRCICSNDINKYDNLLAEIEKLDQQSYQMATLGVESIEAGVDIVGMKNNKATDKDDLLSMWAQSDVEIPEITSSNKSERGAELFNVANKACIEAMPECAANAQIISTMYNQKVKSDCRAYENALKKQKLESQQKLDAAQSALRSAALTKIQDANKYDLGQCTVQFKKCMQTTGGCGEDFSKCATVAAIDNSASTRKVSKSRQTFQIVGVKTNIEISAQTYDALMAKKPLCESVTQSCVKVADRVWDTFIKETAPQLKNAELIAENNVRQNCIVNISDCFQKACKDNMDPNDKDGSYDMCLTRPTTMLNVCQIPLNACGISSNSAEEAERSDIWEFVLARLAAMRVDACTTEVKQCLQSEDRCGEDYTQCIGLDTDSIIRMCPYDKLVGCQQVYGDTDIRGNAVYEQLASMIQGIFVNIDNNFLTACQNAADESMIRVCGDTENCDNLILSDNQGTKSLEYGICEYGISEDGNLQIAIDGCRKNTDQITDEELGRVEGSTSGELGPVKNFAAKMDGMIYWEGIGIDSNGRLTDAETYLVSTDMNGMSESAKKRIKGEIGDLSNTINMIVDTIEADPTVQYCMTGRQVQGMREDMIGREDTARFPNLTRQMRTIIANSALKAVKDNYYKKYDELSVQMLKDYGVIAERQAVIKGENAKDVRRESGRKSCLALANMSSVPKSPPPPPGWGGWMVTAVVLVASIALTVCTFGAAAPLGGLAIASTVATTATSAVAGAAVSIAVPTIAITTSVTAAGIGIATAAAVAGATAIGAMVGGAVKSAKEGKGVDVEDVSTRDLSSVKTMEQYNYRETVTTNYNWENLICNRCIESQVCNKTGSPMFGSKYCKEWGSKQTKCNDIQF